MWTCGSKGNVVWEEKRCSDEEEKEEKAGKYQQVWSQEGQFSVSTQISWDLQENKLEVSYDYPWITGLRNWVWFDRHFGPQWFLSTRILPDVEQLTGSVLGIGYNKAVYSHLVYLAYTQSTTCEMLSRMNHKLNLRLPREISITPDMQTEKAMAPLSSTLTWRIPWTEEPGRLQSMESQSVGHDWATDTFTFKPFCKTTTQRLPEVYALSES